jgi:DNA-binding transcriptional LysR family regulator
LFKKKNNVCANIDYNLVHVDDEVAMALDLSNLEALLAVAECGSIAKAATRLNKVRSAVSYDVRCLEEQLGVPLLDRTGYRAALTEAGNIVLREGERLLSQARALEHLATLMRQKWEPTIKVVLEGAIPMGPVMGAIKAFSRQDVPTLIELKTDFLGGVPERFEREEADLMLVKDFEVSQDEYVVHPLPDVHCVLVAAAEHPLMDGSPPVVHYNDLRDHLELNIQISDEGDGRMPDKRVGGPKDLKLSGFYAKKEALLMGLGFGWMPRALIGSELAQGRLKVIPFEDGPTFQFTPSLMYRKDRPLGRAGTLFRDLLLKEWLEEP